MVRPSRIDFPGAWHHVMHRGARRAPVFLLAPVLAVACLGSATTGCDGDVDADGDERLRILPRDGAIYLGTYDWGSAPTDFLAATNHDPVLSFSVCIGGVEGQPIFAERACFDGIPADRIPQAGIEVRGLEETVDGIIAGAVDEELRQVADVISDWGRPIFWLYQREPSIQFPGYGPTGDLMAWECNEELGCNRSNQFGDPELEDGPERFVALHRRIHDVMEGHIADLGRRSNLTYVMGAIIDSSPGSYTRFYPGDDYVDWHALDVYHGISDEGGAPDCGLRWDDLVASRWAEAMALAPDLPVAIVEFGSHRTNCDRAAYFEDFFASLGSDGDYANLGAIWYWQCGDEVFDTYLGPAGSDAGTEAWRAELEAHPESWSNCVRLSDGSEVGPGC
jgi:hypothetical protein